MASRSIQSSQGRATSCTACRQVKLRCDARETFPAPCTRCVTKKSACRMDSNFRRTPVRRRLEEVTKELNKYQELIGRDVPSVGPQPALVGSLYGSGESSAAQTVPPSGASVASDAASSTLAMNVLISAICFSSDESALGPRLEHFVLGDVHLDRTVAFELFQEFQNHLYSHFPVLDTSKTRDEMYKTCPLLFWTIIITGSKYSPTHSHLYGELIPPYENLLATSIVKVTRSVSQLHAILIIIMWPLPYPGPTHDPSWGYCGLAMNAALQMGMHRPGFHREYGFPDLTQEQVQLRTVTWMMAFQTSVCLSTFLGIPPFIDATPHMDAIVANPSGLPKVIVAQTNIQLQIARFTLALDHTEDAAAKVMYINMFERDLERLRATFESTWSNNVELNLTGAKLYLYSHIFVAGKEAGDSVRPSALSLLQDLASRKIVYSGLTTAVSYIHAFTDTGGEATSPESAAWQRPNRQLYYPHHYWRTLVLAAFYLLKVLALSAEVSEAELELARNHLTTAYNAFLAYPDSIEHSAVAKTIELLVQTTAGIPTQGKVNTRLGASIIYDALLTFGQLQKARGAGVLERAAPQAEDAELGAETPGVAFSPEMMASASGWESFDGGVSLAEFLNTDWNLPWDANFFDIGSEMRDR